MYSREVGKIEELFIVCLGNILFYIRVKAMFVNKN